MENYLILGAIQGIFEWLPVSSEGVVAIVGQFLVKDIRPLETALFLHLGTFLAVMVYFRKDWAWVLTFKNNPLLRFLVVATVVSVLIGFLLYGTIENVAVGPGLLILTGLGLLFTAFFQKKKAILGLNFKELSLVTGVLQGLAVIPGLSRSGATIFGLTLGDLAPKEILKISYMMSAPATLGLTVFLFIKNPALVITAWPALITSFLVGFLTLDILLKVAEKINFFKFALIFATLCFLGGAIILF